MKILFFDDYKLGVLKGDNVVDVSAIVSSIPKLGPHDVINGLIERWDEFRKPIEAAVAAGKGVPLSSVRLRAPLPRPVNIDCMAVNYMEDGTKSEPSPINAFNKAASSIIGPGETMVFPDAPASSFEGEAEIAVIIGKRASNVKPEDAMKHVFGYINFIDGSARGLPPAGNVFFQMKSRDTFAPIGPYIVTADEIADPHMACQIRTRPQSGIGPDYTVSTNLGPLQMGKGFDGHAIRQFDPDIKHTMRLDQNIATQHCVMAQSHAGGINHCCACQHGPRAQPMLHQLFSLRELQTVIDTHDLLLVGQGIGDLQTAFGGQCNAIGQVEFLLRILVGNRLQNGERLLAVKGH